MKKEDKSLLINELAATIQEYSHFYVADAQGLNAADTSNLRRRCYKSDIKLVVVKNTLFQKALEQVGDNFSELFGTLTGSSAVFFCNTGNAPARLIKEVSKGGKKPVLKSAYVQESIFIGANQLEALCNIKSKEEVIGDVIALLQSPAKNVISALQSGGNTIHGVLETLSKK
ncbi:MAG: 50S ribosomal protein L10 [Breznakibacter sp.]|nr:50S ribosomal protein L10 [Breznakibacter sp.]